MTLIVLLLLIPVVICNVAGNTSVRLFVVAVFPLCYLLLLSVLTKSRTIELILATVAYVPLNFLSQSHYKQLAHLNDNSYTTILIVFVSGTIVVKIKG